MARSRRLSVKGPFSGKQRTSSPVAEEEATSEDASISEDELEPDLEEDTPRPRHARPHHVRHQSLSQERDYPLSRPRPDRSGSLLTLKGHRKERLAEKLREIFELDGIHEVWAGTFTSTSLVNPLATQTRHPHRNALLVVAISPYVLSHSGFISSNAAAVLQGYMYLTNNYLCFFAHMPTREVLRALTNSF